MSDIPISDMPNGSWVEVSLLVDGEMAEAVAEVLQRFVTGGVVIESTEIQADDEDEGHPVGPLRVCGYLPIDSQLEIQQSALEEALWYLGRIRPLPPAQFRSIQSADWAEAWKERFKPIAIGKHLLILPTWVPNEDYDRVILRIDPGMAFGTGTHPTTQLCLQEIDQVLEGSSLSTSTQQEQKVIDIGCGSGILAVAALKLGATRALAVDIDPEAVSTAQQNAELNQVSESMQVELGTVGEIRAGTYDIQQAWLVLANILAPVLIRLLDDGLADLVEPGGCVILSGILEEQAEAVILAGEKHGLILSSQRQIDDWVALKMTRSK